MSARSRKTHSKHSRVPGTFIALPHDVIESPAYQDLSHTARSLLIELGRQFNGQNNGKLLLTAKLLKTRGWRSADVIGRAKKELLKKGFIHETVKGYRPNKASWYAVTWQALELFPNYDPGARVTFERGAYRQNPGAGLTPRKRLISFENAPVGTVDGVNPAPPHGPKQGIQCPSTATSAGIHLEIPSPLDQFGPRVKSNRHPDNSFEEKLKNQPISLEQPRVKFSIKAVFGKGRP